MEEKSCGLEWLVTPPPLLLLPLLGSEKGRNGGEQEGRREESVGLQQQIHTSPPHFRFFLGFGKGKWSETGTGSVEEVG